MDISEFLTSVGIGYDRSAGMAAPVQGFLKRAAQELRWHVPGGIVVGASGGKGYATFTPWIGFFDPDETSSPEHGVYVVYLFAEDLRTVTLTLMQGITRLTRELGRGPARLRL